MSATPTRELDQHTSSSPTKPSQPKSFHAITTPSPTDSESVTKEKKPSPSNPEFVSNWKNFNVGDTKYIHHGHLSLIASSALKSETKTKPNKPSSPITKASSNKIVINKSISKLLGLSEEAIDEKSIWPYKMETLNGIINLKIEEEKTKQESIKKDLANTAIELLTLAKSLNVPGELISYLFISDSVTSDSLNATISKIRNETQQLFLKDLSEKSKMDSIIGIKRKHSSTSLKSSGSALVSPLRSPKKLPLEIAHRRVVSDGSDEISNKSMSKMSSPPQPPSLPLPLPPTSVHNHQPPPPLLPSLQFATHPSSQNQNQNQNQLHLHVHLPSLPQQLVPPMYPIFYTPQQVVPQQYNQQQSQQTQQSQQPHSLPSATQDGSGKVQDSPFAQQYQVIYPGHYSGAPNFVRQQYPYYVSSSPTQAAQQYIIQGPPVVSQSHLPQTSSSAAQPQTQQKQQQQPVSSHHFESPDKTTGKSEDDTTPNKRHKNTKGGSINFMITTPKNPPKKRYNNSSSK